MLSQKLWLNKKKIILKKFKGGIKMKQIIVMVAMVALGIALAGFVMNFKGSADTVVKGVNEQITLENLGIENPGGD